MNVKRFSRSKVPVEPEPENKVFIQKPDDEQPETEVEQYAYDGEREDTDADDFLADLHKSNYNPIDPKQEKEDLKRLKEEEREQKKRDKENERLIRQAEKRLTKNKSRVSSSQIEDDIFSDNGTEIIGKDKHILLKKVSQYKSLFKDELKSFKIKRNATEGELKACLDEMQTLVEINSVDEFLTDSILQSIKIIEGVSFLTKNYNVTGLADMLRENKHFNALLKQLFIKYGSYSQIPIEYQMMMIVATSAWICRNKNISKQKIESFLNEPIPIQETKK